MMSFSVLSTVGIFLIFANSLRAKFFDSQVLGAFWYLFSIERETTCWRDACHNVSECIHSTFFCDDIGQYKFDLSEACPIKSPNTTRFDFGIFLDALDSGVVNSMDFPKKIFYCLWWGLRNLR